MKYPEYFDKIETIKLKDGLAKTLGVNEDGILEFTYLDVVKATGHSCATVGGAYLTALFGLKRLYKNEIPVRGEIKVELKNPPAVHNFGAIGTVLSIITGATADLGFGGLPDGKFNRRNLLFFDAAINSDVRFTRLDNGKKVSVNYSPGKVVNPKSIIKSAYGPDAKEEDKASFPKRFQQMVETIFENKDSVIEVVEE